LSNQIDTDAVIAQLNGIEHMSEAAHVTRFRCYREAADGRPQEVTVEIYDSGPIIEEQDDGQEVETRRYYCVARGENGKATSGNSADNVARVLATVHWWELD
jgi:hypothetical protein